MYAIFQHYLVHIKPDDDRGVSNRVASSTINRDPKYVRSFSTLLVSHKGLMMTLQV
jgi:hypothetical protein